MAADNTVSGHSNGGEQAASPRDFSHVISSPALRNSSDESVYYGGKNPDMFHQRCPYK